MDETTASVYSHFIEASVFLALPLNYFTSQLFLPLCLGGG